MGKCHSHQPIETHLRIVNKTNKHFTTYVSGISNDDWSGDSRPDRNFHQVTIHSGHSVERREELKPNSGCGPFTMTLVFTDKARDTFRINQKYAAMTCCNSFEHSVQSHDIFYRRENGNVLVIDVENTQEQLVNQRAEKVNKQGEEAMRKKMYAVALRKFMSAQAIANEPSTIETIRKNLEKASNLDKIQTLRDEGNDLMRRKQFDKATKKFDEAIKLAKEETLIEDLRKNKIRILEEQDNDVAEELMKEGETLMKSSRYSEAAEKFRQAHILASNFSTLNKITEHIDIVNDEYNAQILNDEGKELMKTGRYDAAMRKFNEALKFTQKETMIHSLTENKNTASARKNENERAKTLNKEGFQAMEIKQYETALKKFEEALKSAQEDILKHTILNNKVETLNQFAKTVYEEGFILESDQNEDKSNQAATKFEKAKSLLQQARNIRPTILQENYLKVVHMKIRGNKLYNRGVSLENEASELYRKKNNTAARKKYEEALIFYKKAVKQFEEGASFDNKFDDSVQFTRQQIEDVETVVSNIKKLELTGAINKVEADDKKTQVKVNTNVIHDDNVVINEN